MAFEIVTFGSNSSGNGYLLKDGGSSLLLETGISPKKLNIDLSKVDGILISHEHIDHSKFAHEYLKRGAFSIYTTKGTAESLTKVPKYRITEIEYLKEFRINNWLILAFEVEHDAAQPAGYLIQTPSGKKVLFATDTYYIRYKFSGVTHFLIECNYSLDILKNNVEAGKVDKAQYRRILTSHFELTNLVQFFKANDLGQAEEIHLIHLSDRNSDEEMFINEIEKVTGVPTYAAGDG